VGDPAEPNGPLKLRDHQRKAVDEMHNGCILWGDVGTGKSLTAAAYYMEHEAPRDVYVITTAKKRDSLDWEREFDRFNVGTYARPPESGALKVDSWNNIKKYQNVYGAFFIFDEQRLVGSGAWVKAFLKLAKRNHWILLSATPGDTWTDYLPVFLAHGFFKTRQQFNDAHVKFNPYTKFPMIEGYFNTAILEEYRERLLVHMPLERHTTRHLIQVPVEFDKEATDKVLNERWNIYEDEPIKTASEMFLLLRRIAYSDKTRVARVRELLKKHPRLIIFYNFTFELDDLRTLADMTTVAEWNGQKHEEVPETDSWVYLVQYAAGAEGWNCTTTDAMVFYSLTYSYKMWHQAHGRIDRMNTPYTDLYYYRFLSNSLIDKIVRAALASKKSFNEASFLKKWQKRKAVSEPKVAAK
jgi:hypothetical protein